MSDRASIRLLVVDDDPDIGRLLGALLERKGFTSVRQVSTAEDALAAANDVDIIILDHQLRDSDGIDLLRTLRARPTPPGIVMITGHGNEALAGEALRRGADDYLVKDSSLPLLLPEVLERVRRERAIRRALAEAETELLGAERLAAIGEMTVTLHHEINNPLMSAMGEVDLLLADGKQLTEGQRASLNTTRTALLRIAELVRSVSTLRQSQTKEYAGDLRMIDLDAPEAGEGARQATRGKALFYHSDESIARVGMMVVRRAGWDVDCCKRFDELAPGMKQGGVTLVVYEASQAQPKLDRPAGSIPAVQLLALAADDAAAEAAAGSDLIVRMPFDPLAFARELELLAPI